MKRSRAFFVCVLALGVGCGFGFSLSPVTRAPQLTGTQILPSSVSGLRVWLRADLGVTIATGVSAWADQSGAANSFVQATAGNQPTLVASDALFGNQAVLQFDGVNHYLSDADGDTGFTSQEATWIVVFATDVSQANGTLLSMGITGVIALNDGWRLDVLQNGAAIDQFARAYGLDTGVAVYAPDSLRYTLGSPTVSVSSWSAAAGLGQYLGISLTGTVPAPDPIAGGSFYKMTVGAHNFTPAAFFKGKIAEVIIYNRVLTPEIGLGISCYLQTRYAIALGACG